MNLSEILQCYYKFQYQCCIFALEDILKPENANKFFIITSLEEMKNLNEQIDNISLLLIEYFKGLYYKEQIDSEFLISYSEIVDFIYKSVRNQAKLVSRQLYQQLTKSLVLIVNNLVKNNEKIKILQKQIYCQGLQLIEIKQEIKQLYDEIQCRFQDQLKINYNFPVSQAILAPYDAKINNFYQTQIMDSFRVYQCIDNEIYYENLRKEIELQFLEYLTKKHFFWGSPQIQIYLQQLIYAIEWESTDLSEIAIELLNQIAQKNHIYQEYFKGQELNENILVNFKKYKKCDEAKIWWQENINEEENLQVIFQIYIILSKLQFIDGRLYFGHYDPLNRAALTLIIRVLNNGKYHYLNQSILKLCEVMTFNVQEKIYHEVKNRMQRIKINQAVVLTEPLMIMLQNHKIVVQLGDVKQFYNDNYLLFSIISKYNGKIDWRRQLINQKLKLIKDQYTDFMGQSILENLQFETLTRDNSNVVTLVISGFLSGDQDKSDYWKGLLSQESGTVVALHWNCGQPINFAKYIVNKVLSKFSSKIENVKGSFDQIIYTSYKQAYDEAIKVGKYLSFLIAEHKLFGDCQINIIVHSLGSVILLECIRLLDQLYSKYKKQQINQILIMGGVVDVNKLQRRKWNSVGGKVYNVYSKKDQVLMLVLKIPALFDSPCGLQKIHLGYMPVVNCDFTDIVDGHFDYKNQLQRILLLTDFNNDFKFMISL